MGTNTDGAGAFTEGPNGVLHASQGRDGPTIAEELAEMLDRAQRAGPGGIMVMLDHAPFARQVAESIGGKRLRAYHAVERLVDIGALQWRPKRQGGGYGNMRWARITELGAELQQAAKGKRPSWFYEGLARSSEAAELVTKFTGAVAALKGMLL